MGALDRTTVDGGQADPEDRTGVPGIDHAVVVDPSGQEQRGRLLLDLCLDHRAAVRRRQSVSKSRPAAFAVCRPMIDMTPASCCAPITADFALGQANRNLGSYARPHMP